MSDASAIDAATRRLMLALDALEAAAEQRRESDLGKQALAVQIHVLDDDRSRLASDLDTAVARSRSLEHTNRDVARRLDAAIESIRSVLEIHDR
jgi:hypothetical protein